MKLALIFEFEFPDEELDEVQHTIEIVRDEVKARTNGTFHKRAFIAISDKAEEVISTVTPEEPDPNDNGEINNA